MSPSDINPFQRTGLSLDDYQTSRRAKAEKIMQILRHFQDNLNQAVTLDIGCYDGCMTQQFSTQMKQIIGVDIDQHALQNSAEQYAASNLNFIAYNGNKLPFSDHCFDLLIVNHVLYYVDTKEQINFLNELNRVIKADGICYLSAINGTYTKVINKLPHWARPIAAKALLGAPVNFGHPVSLSSYKKMLSMFDIEDVTFQTLKNPTQFAGDFQGWKRQLLNLISKLPDRIIKTLANWSPALIVILRPANPSPMQD